MKRTSALCLALCLSSSNLRGVVFAKTYQIPELVERVKSENFAAKEKAESLIRSYHNIKIAVGRLAPSLNFNTVVAGIEQNYYGLAASLFGFLFPSNWYKWKESKAFFEAERFSYATLIANETNSLITSYYRIHSLVMLKDMYDGYLQDFKNILATAQIRFQEAEESVTRVQEIQNTIFKLQADIVLLQEELKKVQFELAKALNLPVDEWNDFSIKKLSLPDLNFKPQLQPKAVIAKAKEVSYELRQLDFIIEGAKKSIRSRAFDFLNPAGEQDASFGFGYKSYIEVGRSNHREMSIKKSEQETNIVFAANEAVNNYNASINLFKTNFMGLNNTKELKNSLLLELESGEDLDLEKFVDLLDSLFTFHSKLLQSQHKFLIAKNQIERLRLDKPYYNGLIRLAPEKPRGIFY